MNDIKIKGVVYTPPEIVQYIVDSLLVGEISPQVKLVDPSCGDGRFLSYAAESLSRILHKPIQEVFRDNIFGFDCDPAALQNCRDKLGETNLFCGNSIDPNFVTKHFGQYDFVVGNPPYVRTQNLSAENRDCLRSWQFTQGNTDLYIPFIELAFRLINSQGAVGYITPNSFLKNKSQKKFLKWLLDNRLIRSIIDFKHYQIFPEVSTYCAIFTGDKKTKQTMTVSWPTQDGQSSDVKDYDLITIEDFAMSKEHESKIRHFQRRGKKLKDIARISVGLATLADYIYFLSDYKEEQDCVIVGDHRIEKQMLKPCVKVGKLKTEEDLKNNTRYIIYPYHQDGKPFTENELSQFPGVYRYLKSHKQALLNRDKGKLKSWFLYGRSQGIKSLWGKKLLIPPIVKEPKFIYSEQPDLLYISGYAIIEPKGTDLITIKQKLETKDFQDYLHILSKDYQGGWKSCAKHMIQDFSICLT